MRIVESLNDFLSFDDDKNRLLLQTSEEIKIKHDFRYHVSNLIKILEDGDALLGKSLSFLGFDFAFVYQNKLMGKAVIGSGHRSLYKTYYRMSGDEIEVRSGLPRSSDCFEIGSQIDKDWIKYFFATGLSCGPAEVIPVNKSILKGWSRVPPGHILKISNKGSSSIIPFDNISNAVPIGKSAVETAREALLSNIRELSKIGSVCCEFSGGIDSGIVLSAASRHIPNFKCGITAAYPFKEFRRESVYRDSIVGFTGTSVEYVNFTEMLPFSHIDTVPPHDEPSINSTSWGQFNALTSLAHQVGAQVLLTGHAGDNLFGIHPLMKVAPVVGSNVPEWVPKAFIDEVADAACHIARYLNQPLSDALGGFWHPSILESGFLQRYTGESGRQVRYVSGLMSPDFINALRNVWLHSDNFSAGVQKPVANHVFKDMLPEEVWQRPGKVNHLGNVYRGAMLATVKIEGLSQSLKVVCEVLDLNFNKTFEWVKQICNGRDSGNQFFTQLMSIVIWLDRSAQSSQIDTCLQRID